MSSHDPTDPTGDPFGPPPISTEVFCLHCGEEYDSYRIEWRVLDMEDGSKHGFWCCPIEGCDGKGFGFDIFPTDPEYRDENGEAMWTTDDEDDSYEEDFLEDEEFMEKEFDPPPAKDVRSVDRKEPPPEDQIPF